VKSENVVLSNIFSIGDVCKTPSDEEKAILPIHIMTSVLARNLVNLISNKHFDNLESIPNTLHRVYLINLGTQGHGMIVFNDFVLKAYPKIPLYDIQKAKNLIKWINLGDLQGKRIQKSLIDL
jgi:hypothetical protein